MTTKTIIAAIAAKKFNSLSYEEIKNLFGEKIAEQVGYKQNNPHHCYDLWGHTVAVVESVKALQLNEEERPILLVAALLHDMGKPEVAMEKKDRMVFYNHEAASASAAAQLLKEWGFSDKEEREICFFIRNHGKFMPYKFVEELQGKHSQFLKEICKEEVASLYNQLANEYGDGFSLRIFNLLIDLCVADVEAQAEEAWINGKLVDTRKRKIARLLAIKAIAAEL